MTLLLIDPPAFDIALSLAYAKPDNITGQAIYSRPLCYLHRAAVEKLNRAIDLARPLGLRLLIFDAFRPVEAQQRLWQHFPDPTFIADPAKGSDHSRGVAIDLTLVDAGSGKALDMGTIFDDFTAKAFHGNQDISVEAQRNRALLLGLMTAAGWDWYAFEWWHYQLFDVERYPLLTDSAAPQPMMASGPDSALTQAK